MIGKSDRLAYPVPRSAAADPSNVHTANNGFRGLGAVKIEPEALPRGATKMACGAVAVRLAGWPPYLRVP